MTDEVTPLTPEGLKSIKLEKAFRGYDPRVVDQLLRELSTSIEGMRAERKALKEQIQNLEKELSEHREAQSLMRDALVSAQRAADELRERTQKESDEVIARARAEAAELQRDSLLEKERAEASVKRLRAQEQELRASYRVLLAAALDRLESEGNGGSGTASLLDALAPRRLGQSDPGS
jgi:cell division initiation protein